MRSRIPLSSPLCSLSDRVHAWNAMSFLRATSVVVPRKILRRDSIGIDEHGKIVSSRPIRGGCLT